MVEIARVLEQAGHEAWCVGGALRDAILARPHADFDLATSASPEEVQKLFRRTVPVGLRFGTVGVLDAAGVLHEVTTFRRDIDTDGRHAEVSYGASLEEDLARRDFTVNALAFHPLRGEWRDPFGGAADLARGVIRAVGEPAARFREDFLRVLRALRFAARLDFEIDPATWEAALEAAPGLTRLSAERVRDEWERGLQWARSLERFARLWHEVGAAAVVLPELLPVHAPAAQAVFRHDQGPVRDPILLTAILCDSPAAVLERLRASNADIARAGAIARGPAEPSDPEPVAVRRWMAATGPAADDLMAAWELRHGQAAPWADTVAGIRERREPLGRTDLAVTGNDLVAAGVAPGPALGRLIDRLVELVLDDPSLNRRETLLARARELA
ncbi:MAG: CCA tRNA nucleotidyltransferase [Gemmatimonadales bacterium]